MILALAYRKGSSRLATVVLSQPHTRLLLTVDTPWSYVSIKYLASTGIDARRTELTHGDRRVKGVHTEHLLYPPVPSRFSGCWTQHTSLHVFDFLIRPNIILGFLCSGSRPPFIWRVGSSLKWAFFSFLASTTFRSLAASRAQRGVVGWLFHSIIIIPNPVALWFMKNSDVHYYAVIIFFVYTIST